MPPLTDAEDETLAIVPPRLYPTSAPVTVPPALLATVPPSRARSRIVPELLPIKPTEVEVVVLAIDRLAIAWPSPVRMPVKAGSLLAYPAAITALV
ncbi:hypothetical protein CHKEEEPN_0523 [Methylorubrum podarium]|nr:hypothetical protein CHKEEEPN_0523 [Methylorubrum podarium]